MKPFFERLGCVCRLLDPPDETALAAQSDNNIVAVAPCMKSNWSRAKSFDCALLATSSHAPRDRPKKSGEAHIRWTRVARLEAIADSIPELCRTAVTSADAMDCSVIVDDMD